MGGKARRVCPLHKSQPRFWIEFATVEFTAAIETGDGAFERPDAGKILAASGTTIKEPAGALLDREREGMAARFIGDAQVAAGLSPSGAVWGNTQPAGAELGEQMGQLMAQGAINLGRVVLAQARIQRDQVAPGIGPARRAEESCVPFDMDFAGELVGAEGREDFTGGCFQSRVASENHRRKRRRKDEVELLVIGFRVHGHNEIVGRLISF
jgi:hypothetical protein